MTTSLPSISVVIPCYCCIKTIESAVESIDKQTIKPLEIILIDDASTDNTLELLLKIQSNYTKDWIKVISLDKNGGPSKARNIGIKEANGEYIAFLDSDDVWHQLKLEIVSNILKENNVDLLGHALTLNDFSNQENYEINIIRVPLYKLLVKNFAATPCVIMRKDIKIRFNEKMSYAEDHDLWLRIAVKKNVFYLNQQLTKLGRIPLTQGGLSGNKWAMRKGEMLMYINFSLDNKQFFPILPLLLGFSLIKHVKNILFYNFK